MFLEFTKVLSLYIWQSNLNFWLLCICMKGHEDIVFLWKAYTSLTFIGGREHKLKLFS